VKDYTQWIDRLLERIGDETDAQREGRRRVADVVNNRPTDVLPIAFGSPVELHVPPPGRREFEDPAAMLAMQLRGAASNAAAGSDAQPTVRVNLGVGFLTTAVGVEYLFFDDKMPWVNSHLSREQLDAWQPDGRLAEAGLLPRCREFIAYYRSKLPEHVHIYLADTQGVFDQAHLMRGNDFFIDLYDAPEFIDRLLDKCLTLYVEGSRLMKQWIGEADGQGYHGGIYLDRAAVRSCEDTTTLVSPAHIEALVLPRLQRSLAAFGGGWVHYCGRSEGLWRGLMNAVPAAPVVNFGNPEMHDWPAVAADVLAANKCYYGTIPRRPGEGLEDYFRRVLAPLDGEKRGLIFRPRLVGDESRQPQRILDLWRGLQR